MKAIDPYLCPPLSRFLHYASEQGRGVNQIDAQAFEQFGQAVRRTSLNSKAEKTIRNSAKAWKRAQQTIAGWPEVDLAYQPRRREVVIRPWSSFPASLEMDARAFVTRDDLDLLTEDRSLKPLKPRTQQNYLDGIRRAASIAVILGRQPGQLRQLADLTVPDLVRRILILLRERTKRIKGGHVEFIAVLLLVVGRDYVRMEPVEIAGLTRLWKATHRPGMAMSERTFTRLRQFDDEAYVQAFLNLPSRLMALAEKANPPTVGSAKLARAALFLRLLFETAVRQGNIVGLDLNRHVMIEGDGKKLRAWIMIPEAEVKNGEPVRAELSNDTAHMLRRYIGRYRHIHCCGEVGWLFPRLDGSHWTPTQACTDLKDLTARHVGIDVTPHVIRSFAGKIILDAHPGALGEVQQLLGHRSVTTTQAFYAPIDRAKVRARYQSLLNDRADRK